MKRLLQAKGPSAVPDVPPPFSPPTLLAEVHDGSAFDSGEPALGDWLRKRTWNNSPM